MARDSADPRAIRTIDIKQQVTIGAAIDRVFEAITTGIGDWWTHGFDDEPKDVVLEPRVGGRFYEDWGDGQGALYATVQKIRAPRLLAYSGPMGMARATNFITFELETDGESTRLRLTHFGYGDFDDDTLSSYSGGWRALLDGSLRDAVERGLRRGPRGRVAAR